MIGIGIIGAIAAAVFGLDLLAIPSAHPSVPHRADPLVLNLTVVVLFAVSFAIRRDHLDDGDVTAAVRHLGRGVGPVGRVGPARRQARLPVRRPSVASETAKAQRASADTKAVATLTLELSGGAPS